ncbi:MAG: hypothetical protein IKZ87_03610, partial [Actinomycetaceae bacterium]|nr:hypothetical protein [Actinomycetaceae bacterium]
VTFPLLFVFWDKTEEGLAFSLWNYTGIRAFETFAEHVSEQLPEEFECRYLGSSNAKARYVIALHNPKLPVVEAEL